MNDTDLLERANNKIEFLLGELTCAEKRIDNLHNALAVIAGDIYNLKKQLKIEEIK